MDDVDDAAGTLPAQVCQACRLRHKKCDFDGPTCRQCQSLSIECIRQPSFRFRYDPKQAALAYESPTAQRRWAQPYSALEFHDETPGLLQFYTGVATEVPHANAEQSITVLTNESTVTSSGTFASNTPAVVYISPSSDLTSPEHTIGRSPGQLLAVQPFTEAEAVLIRNFQQHMALWTDVTDRERSFEFEAPRRALTEPVLRHAICAFSARHYHRDKVEGAGETEALDHQNKCLELLIPAMSEGQGIVDSTLAAIAVLRQNEEMDEQDNRFHLEGTSRILNMAPDFVAAGGLGEAAAWLCLREAIYVSLTTQSPITIQTDSFYNAASIRRGDDFSWTNKMVLALAVLLNRVFSEPATLQDLAASEAEVSEWDKSKPAAFNPIHSRPRSPTIGRHFPEIWMLAPHHAVGLQYFHIAQIVLALLKRRVSLLPYDGLSGDRARERQIRAHLLTVVGIAVSNERAENTWFTASHSLSVWGGCLRKRGDQQAALQFFRDMEMRTGWRTAAFAKAVRTQWDEESDEG